jgi:hypothetical protein
LLTETFTRELTVFSVSSVKLSPNFEMFLLFYVMNCCCATYRHFWQRRFSSSSFVLEQKWLKKKKKNQQKCVSHWKTLKRIRIDIEWNIHWKVNCKKLPHLNDEQQNKNKMASICVGLFLLLATRVDMSLCGDTSIQTSPNGFGFSAETEILVSIILLVILYLLSKFLLAHHEPNVCVYGNVRYFWSEALILSKCIKNTGGNVFDPNHIRTLKNDFKITVRTKIIPQKSN